MKPVKTYMEPMQTYITTYIKHIKTYIKLVKTYIKHIKTLLSPGVVMKQVCLISFEVGKGLYAFKCFFFQTAVFALPWTI